MGWFRSKTPPPLVKNSDGNMVPSDGKQVSGGVDIREIRRPANSRGFINRRRPPYDIEAELERQGRARPNPFRGIPVSRQGHDPRISRSSQWQWQPFLGIPVSRHGDGFYCDPDPQASTRAQPSRSYMGPPSIRDSVRSYQSGPRPSHFPGQSNQFNQNFSQQGAPPPRTGRVREGDPLPPGMPDPLATVSPDHPLGHHGMREHVAGMSRLNPERHGKADDPMANFKVLEEMAGLDGQGRR